MKTLLIFLFLAAQLGAAISANTVWQVRTDGADTNGGGFVTGASGTDFTDQAAAQYALTGVTTAGADAILLDANAAANMVGNIANIVSGTNFTAGSYEIISVVAGVSITLDRTCTSAAGALGVVNIGGSKLTLADVDDDMIGGNICFIKAGTYTVTTAWTVTLNTATATRFVGFNTTRTVNNTDATRPLITTATDSVVPLTFNLANGSIFRNLEFTNTATTKVRAMANVTAGSGLLTPITFINSKWSTAFTGMINTTSAATSIALNFEGCEISGTATNVAFIASGSATSSFAFYGCYIHDNAAGFINFNSTGTTNGTFVRNIISDNARGIYVTATTGAGYARIRAINNTFANNTTSAIESDITSGTAGSITLENNIIYGSAQWIDNATAGVDTVYVTKNNAFGGGGSNTNFTTGDGSVSLSGDPFVSAAGDNYALNNTAGAGASCRAAGWPTTFPGGLTASTVDIGAAQHADAGGATQKSYSY